MDFKLEREIDALRNRVRDFVEERVMPLESDRANYDEHDNIRESVLAGLRDEVRRAGLWAPQVPRDQGGLGLDTVGMAAVYEEMGRSIFGPVCFNCAAPDDGNMLLLGKVGTPSQQQWWLKPVVEGQLRSAFAMTEPMPGAGSDPAAAMRTVAERRAGGWSITGRKWFVTGAESAGRLIVIARTSQDARKGLTAFLFAADQPGWRVVRRIPVLGPEEHGGHCELEFDGLVVRDQDVLLGVGEGLKVTQIRLGTARLTHCMRWLGMARRALEIALPYVSARDNFGAKLIDHEGVQWLLGEAATQIDIGRLLTMRAAWRLDQGEQARTEVSMAKIQVADALQRAVDTSLQLLGALGYSRDTPVEWMYRYARQARLVDGASEVHKMVIARSLRAKPADFWCW